MKIITVRQPWAWAIVGLGKDVENRTRNIAGSYRGPVAIHAAKHFDADEIRAAISTFPIHAIDDNTKMRLQLMSDPIYVGAIIGVVDLVDVHEADSAGCLDHRCDDQTGWAHPAGHHLVLEKPRALATPIPFKGALGLRELDAATEALVWEGLA